MAVRLEVYKGRKTRHRCPGCGKAGEFTRYIDTETGEYLADHVGRCNRESSCGYHYPPKQWWADNPHRENIEILHRSAVVTIKPEQPISFLDNQHVQKSIMVPYPKNNLYRWLSREFGEAEAQGVFEKYKVGTSVTMMPGATAYWQIDIHHRVRQCKVIQYDPLTGKRDKTLKAKFVGKQLVGYEDLRLEQCFFGEHLLSENPGKTVAIVEGEKTALICDIAYPDMIWLATGAATGGCKWKSDIDRVCKPLEGRDIVLFPDLGATDEWKERAFNVRSKIKCRITVSEALEQIATEEEKRQGLDIADFLIKTKSTEICS